jgi:hypothetical protein
MGFGVLLPLEGLEVAVAVLIDVIDDPFLPKLAPRTFPNPLADRRRSLLSSKLSESARNNPKTSTLQGCNR